MLNTRKNCAFQPHYLQKHACNSKSFKISFSTYYGVCLLYVTIKAWMMHNIQQCPVSWVVPSNLLSNVLTTLTVSLVLFNLFCLRGCVFKCWLWNRAITSAFCWLKLLEVTFFFLSWLSWFWKSTVTIHVTSRPWTSLTMYHPRLFRLWLKSKNSAANFTFQCASVTPLQWPLGSTHVWVPECKGCSVTCF